MDESRSQTTFKDFCGRIEDIFNACPGHLQLGLVSWFQDFSQQRLGELGSDSDQEDISEGDDLSQQIFMLNGIRQDLQHELPLTCELDSATLFPSDSCELSVDAFVYDSDDLDLAVEQGDISLHKCRKCGSRDVQSLETVTHSLSVGEMVYIYKYMLPSVLRLLNRKPETPSANHTVVVEPDSPRGDGLQQCESVGSDVERTKRVLLDVGSRTGAVLFGAYYLYEHDLDLYGVEMDKTFADLSTRVARNYKIPAFKVFADDIMSEGKGHASLLQSAHFVVMHNVFEYFAEPEKQIQLWRFCLENLRKNPDLLLITSPSLRQSLDKLKLPEEMWSFLQPLRVPGFCRKEFLEKHSERFDMARESLDNISIYSHIV